MDRIHYAGGELLTGSNIARSLLAYAEALAQRDSAASVEIPVRHSDGTVGRASILIGPASQLVSESETLGGEELVDDALVAELDRRTAGLATMRPVTGIPANANVTDDPIDFDWDGNEDD
jgi:hypothetical protein